MDPFSAAARPLPALVLVLALLTGCAWGESPSAYARRPFIADQIDCPDDQITRDGAELNVCGYAYTARCRWRGITRGTRCSLFATEAQTEQNRALAARQRFAADTACAVEASSAALEPAAQAREDDAPMIFRVSGCDLHARYSCGGGGQQWTEFPRCARIELLHEGLAAVLPAAKALFIAHKDCPDDQITPLPGYPRRAEQGAAVELLLQGCARTRAFTCTLADAEGGDAACVDISPDEARVAAEDRAAAEHFMRSNTCSFDQLSVTTLRTLWGTSWPRETLKRVAGCGAFMDVRCVEVSLSAPQVRCAPVELP